MGIRETIRTVHLKLRFQSLAWRIARLRVRLHRAELDRMQAGGGALAQKIQTAIELVAFFALVSLCGYLAFWSPA